MTMDDDPGLDHPLLSADARDEIEALAAIYAPHFVRAPHATAGSDPAYLITVPMPDSWPAHLHPRLRLTFPDAYPLHALVTVHFDACPLWSGDMRSHATNELATMWAATNGGCAAPDEGGIVFARAGKGSAGLHPNCHHGIVLFDWIEWLREYVADDLGPMVDAMLAAQLNSAASNDAVSAAKAEAPAHIDDKAAESGRPDLPDLTVAPTPTIDRLYSHSDPVIDRKSVFLAHSAYISSPADPAALTAYLTSHRRIARATHNITAYRLEMPNGIMHQDCDDDGEDAAGKRLLHLLQLVGARNVWVCVTRWYGGIQLGPDRFAHINNAARAALVSMGVVEGAETSQEARRKAAAAAGGGRR
ncbi:eIF2 kinase Gcn2p negative regulator [Allomyces javanicus]|nr:eIF2 kinase Gcn2p negative regulator [Allomyces javanicus]